MKTKHILFTIALFFSVAFTNAQDKYEFAIIEYNISFKNELKVFINGKDLIEEKAEEDNKGKLTYNAFLKKVNEYQDKGWEVMSFAIVPRDQSNIYYNHFAYMRKKIK